MKCEDTIFKGTLWKSSSRKFTHQLLFLILLLSSLVSAAALNNSSLHPSSYLSILMRILPFKNFIEGTDMFHALFDSFFDMAGTLNDITWSYLCIPAILIFGLYFSFKARWIQFTQFGAISKLFFNLLKKDDRYTDRGISPLRTFFAAIGGCIGVGNVVGVCTAVQIGGPGAIFWMWVAALLGMIVKYSEIYLGIKYRVPNDQNGYNGGPMYFLKRVDASGKLSKLFCILMCLYGVEVYMFRIVTQSLVSHWGLNEIFVIIALLIAVILGTKQGVKTVGIISGAMIPLFLVGFGVASLWVFIQHAAELPGVFMLIMRSAFSGHAALGAFAGSTILVGMSHGMKRACYAGDIGIGYASIIHSETKESIPEKQACLAIIEIFIDAFVVCTMSVLLITVTGLWNQDIHAERVVATALEPYIPHIHLIWPIFIFLLGYSTLIAYFAVGKKSAHFLWPRWGEKLYSSYAVCAFLLFSFVGTELHIMEVMSTIGACLLLLNLYGIFKLRNDISFVLPFGKNTKN